MDASNGVVLRPLEDHDAAQCAQMMQASDPWVTLGTKPETLLGILLNPERNRTVAVRKGRIAGCIVVNTGQPLSGYVQAICVAPGERGSGIGRRLMEHAEAGIFAGSPNVFLFVSDFNATARGFYERLGYRKVGELPDYLVTGRSEVLMRKTRGPIRGYAGGSR